MQVEAQSTPAPEVSDGLMTPASELETETVTADPEDVADEATEGTDEEQSESTGDGTDEQTTAEEERRAGLREADYTKKTQELAEARKATEAIKSRLESASQQAEVLVRALHEEFQSEFQGLDWAKLAAEDPAEYVRKQHALTVKQQKLQAALYHLNQTNAAKQEVDTEVESKRLETEYRELISKVPSWKDEAVRTRESTELAGWLRKQGYTDDDISALNKGRHQDVVTARKAMLYDRLIAKVPKAQAAPSAPPPPPPAPSKAKAAPNPEKMSMDDWLKWRNRDIAKKQGRA